MGFASNALYFALHPNQLGTLIQWYAYYTQYSKLGEGSLTNTHRP
jgi:hypothetical protein